MNRRQILLGAAASAIAAPLAAWVAPAAVEAVLEAPKPVSVAYWISSSDFYVNSGFGFEKLVQHESGS